MSGQNGRGQIILDVNNLEVEFDTYGGVVHAVRGVSFSVRKGETLGIVGESGCGKSVTVQSLMGLIPMPPGRITNGTAHLNGKNIIGLTQKELNKVRGREIAMIFQDPMTSLNPTMKIGHQIAETLIVHKGMSQAEGFKEAERLLDLTKIPEAGKRVNQYPFEFSGGMLQRAMIATAIACKPNILVADEPTTALDVTIQSQILDLMNELKREVGMAIILITHDLGVVARMADDVAVMYAGQIIEYGEVDDIFYRPSHPYTIGLRAAMPVNDEEKSDKLMPIEGSPPDLFHPPVGCGYFARCPYSLKVCKENLPIEFKISDEHSSLCWLHDKRAPDVKQVHQLGRQNDLEW